jgi:diguanylate cyclase (GGDEF)-like protein
MLVPLGLGLLVTFLLIWSLGRRLVRSTAQLMASEAQARQLAFHDVLTGLPNRALFEDRLDRALGQSITSGRPATLLLLDLDRFKCVNDTLGHPAGDDLIREVARRLSGLIRKDDTAARLGGDEFAIILNGVNGRREINSFCRRVNKTLTAPFDLLGSQAFIGVSIGLARAPLDGLDRSELTRKADIALYEAKASGRGCHRIFGATMDTAVQYRRRIERELREALRDGSQLELHYQPQYDASSLSIRGVEALVRWNHPDLGLLAPTTFVPIAEECGLAEDLGNWVLKQACRSAREWPDLVVSVNVSAVQVRSVKFVESVLRIVGEARLDPRRLELELTETALLDNLAQCEANLSALRSHGVRIALDDFGTGYSSLSHLRSIRIDRVKIDQSFVQGMEDETGGAIIQAIVYLARSTGLRVTAEGVETSRQRELLSHIGCDELQGFGLSTPLPFEAFDAAYRSRFPRLRQVAA